MAAEKEILDRLKRIEALLIALAKQQGVEIPKPKPGGVAAAKRSPRKPRYDVKF